MQSVNEIEEILAQTQDYLVPILDHPCPNEYRDVDDSSVLRHEITYRVIAKERSD